MATAHGPVHQALQPRAVVGGLILAVALLVFLVVPILVLLVFGLVTAANLHSARAAAQTTTGIFATVFAWMNVDKLVSGDWTWYTQHYELLKYTSLSGYLGHYVPPFTIRSTEPIYYTLSYVLSRVSDANVSILAIVVTAIDYGLIGLAIASLVKQFTVKPGVAVVATSAALLLGPSFTLITQLVRQEMASSLIAAGSILIWKKHRLIGLLTFAMAIATHNSAALPVAVIIAAALVVHVKVDGPGLVLLRLSAVLASAGVGYLYGHSSAGESYTEAPGNGSISVLTIAGNVAILAAFLYMQRTNSQKSKTAFSSVLLSASVMYLGLLAALLGRPIPLLRMYFYLEDARTLMVAAICCWFFNRPRSAAFVIPALVTAVAYFELRLTSAPYSFGGGLVQHLTRGRLIG